MDADQEYVYSEQLAILGCYGEPTPEQHEIAMADVLRFNKEIKSEINELSPNT